MTVILTDQGLSKLLVAHGYDLLGGARCGSCQGLRILALGSVGIAREIRQRMTGKDELLAIDMDAARCDQLSHYCSEVICGDFFKLRPDHTKRADLIVMKPNRWIAGSTIDCALLYWLADGGVLIAAAPSEVAPLVNAAGETNCSKASVEPIPGTELSLVAMKRKS